MPKYGEEEPPSPLFQTRHYNSLADAMANVIHNTKVEHIPIACNILLRLITTLSVTNGNLQIGRMMDAAGIPRSTDPKDTRRA